MTGFIKRAWIGLRRRTGDMVAETRSDVKSNFLVKGGLIVFVAVFIGLVILGMFWSATPDPFDVRQITENTAAAIGQPVVAGTATTVTLINVSETLLDKPGGFITNDIMPPGVWLDNMPSWEYGVLIQVRDLSKAMREAFSRSQSQSTEDEDLAVAESRFNFNNDSWALPPTESEYRDGIHALREYLVRLGDDDARDAQFYARADNLRYWLSTVETRLGSLSQRLTTAVGQRRLNTDLSGAPGAAPATPQPADEVMKTPWTQIDNVFYEARGSAWALMHFLKAVEIDFADVLENKNARVSLQQIIRELEGTQHTVWSPMILNGDGFGFLANHSLVMASYISRANAAIIDLRELLAQG